MLIVAENVTKTYAAAGRADAEVLKGISLEVAENECVAVVGPSGSGKSTLLSCLAGIEPVSTGSVIVDGVDITRAGRNRVARLRRERIGFVFQTYNLIPSLTVGENVMLPSRLAGRSISRAAMMATLASVGMAGLEDAAPDTLSGGQQQRVAIARALLSDPPLIFADEPTGALDSVSARQVIDLLLQSVGVGRSLLLVTHDAEAASRADRVLVLRDGLLHRELSAPTAAQVFDAVAEAA